MRLRDKENAVGEVLAALVRYIVPNYDGRNNFHDWARFCTTAQADRPAPRGAEGREHLRREIRPKRSTSTCCPTAMPHGRDLNFLEFTAELSDRQATVLWLRYYRGMSVEASRRC